MSVARAVLLVTTTDLRRRIRNRSALVMAVVGPLAMAIVFSVLAGGTSTATFEIGVVDADGSPLSSGIVASLLDPAATVGEEREVVTFVSVEDEASARTRTDDGDLDAALVIGAGDGTRPTLTVLRSPDRAVSGEVAAAIGSSIAARFDLVALVAAGAADRGVAPTPALLDAASRSEPVLQLTEIPVGARQVDVGAYFGASMSVLFLFFTVGFAAASLLRERRDGTLDRVLSTPTAPWAVLVGKTASVAILGFGGFVVVWLATTLLFGAPWGDPLGVVVLIATTVAAIAGVSLFVSSFARTEQQAQTSTATITFVFALLGGNFVGPGQGPALLRTLSLFTPNGWALRGFTDLSADAVGPAGIALDVAVLVAIGALFGAMGLFRLHRVVAPGGAR